MTEGVFCAGTAHLDGIDIARIHKFYTEHAPPLDKSVALHTARARQAIGFGRAASAAGAPLPKRVLTELAHYINPDALGLWEDMGTLAQSLRTLDVWLRG